MNRLALVTAGLLALTLTAARADMSDLLAKSDLYGYDILKNVSVRAAATRLAGRDLGTFEGILNVSPPAVKVANRYVFGKGCRPHQCDETGALIVVDTRSGELFMAMTDGRVRKAWPAPVKQWPANIRAIVRANDK